MPSGPNFQRWPIIMDSFLIFLVSSVLMTVFGSLIGPWRQRTKGYSPDAHALLSGFIMVLSLVYQGPFLGVYEIWKLFEQGEPLYLIGLAAYFFPNSTSWLWIWWHMIVPWEKTDFPSQVFRRKDHWFSTKPKTNIENSYQKIHIGFFRL